MLASYRWIVSCTLLFGFLGGTSLCAKSTDAQQEIPKRNRDNITSLTTGSHGLGPVYSGKTSYGLADFALDLEEHSLFDIFCSAVDTDWLRPGENSSTSTLQRLGGLGSKPAMRTRRRYQLRPC
jgi:hypothetical protein